MWEVWVRVGLAPESPVTVAVSEVEGVVEVVVEAWVHCAIWRET